MAHGSELFDCVICLQVLEEPVTTACGHSYCMRCINSFWDTKQENERKYSCPQCRTTFRKRPALQKNTLLAGLLEEHKRKSSPSAAAAAAAEDVSALPEDVQCDACTQRKQKAAMFCLTCLASYCEEHLQPHLDVAALKKHHLIQASARIKESICSRHDRRLEFYCRSDRQLLCPLCVVEHRDHSVVEVAAEVHGKRKHLDRIREQIEHKMEVSKSKMTRLMDAADSIRDAAWEACNDFEQHCTEHTSLYGLYLEKRCSEMREKVGELEKTGVDWMNGHLGPLQREVFELKRMKNELRQLSNTDDPIQFFQDFQTLPGDFPAFTNPQEPPDTLTGFVTAHVDKLKRMCDKQKDESSSDFKTITMSQILKRPRMGNTSRENMLFLRRNTKLELDPDTVNACLYVTRTKKEISWGITGQAHPDHPDRFTYYYQALCQTGLQGNHYWEVEWDGGIVEAAVSYRTIQRKGSGKDSCFGHNKLSWKLICSPSGCTFWHNNLHKGHIPAVPSRVLGVLLEYDEGKLSFYSVSSPDRSTLLHQIQTSFTEPVYPGFSVDLGATLTIC